MWRGGAGGFMRYHPKQVSLVIAIPNENVGVRSLIWSSSTIWFSDVALPWNISGIFPQVSYQGSRHSFSSCEKHGRETHRVLSRPDV